MISIFAVLLFVVELWRRELELGEEEDFGELRLVADCGRDLVRERLDDRRRNAEFWRWVEEEEENKF